MTGIFEILAALLMLAGGAFTFIAGLGVLRMPDVYVRMHASTKAGTLGVGLIMAAIAMTAESTGVVAKALAAIAFVILTAPVAAHLIGRAAYRAGVPLWHGTVVNELVDGEVCRVAEGDQAPAASEIPASAHRENA